MVYAKAHAKDDMFIEVMARHTSSGNSGKLFEALAHIAASVLNVVPRSAQLVETVGNIAGFRRWAKSQGSIQIYRNRESLWAEEIVGLMPLDVEGALLEFGVAFGEGIGWWSRNVTSPNFRLVGFDRFRGLPRAWRNMPAGAFHASGNTPEIDDPRIHWVVGDIEETITTQDWSEIKGIKVFLFDLDLYGVSKACWDSISPYLNQGDFIYFDEAFDADERTLINESVIPSGLFEIVAASPLGVAYRRR